METTCYTVVVSVTHIAQKAFGGTWGFLPNTLGQLTALPKPLEGARKGRWGGTKGEEGEEKVNECADVTYNAIVPWVQTLSTI